MVAVEGGCEGSAPCERWGWGEWARAQGLWGRRTAFNDLGRFLGRCASLPDTMWVGRRVGASFRHPLALLVIRHPPTLLISSSGPAILHYACWPRAPDLPNLTDLATRVVSPGPQPLADGVVPDCPVVLLLACCLSTAP